MIKSNLTHNFDSRGFTDAPISFTTSAPKRARMGKEWQILAIVIALASGGWGIAYAKDAYSQWQTDREIQTCLDAMADLGRNNDTLRKSKELIDLQINANKESWTYYNEKVKVLKNEPKK